MSVCWKQVIERVNQGEREAIEEFGEILMSLQFLPYLRKHVRPEEAEDLHQEMCLSIFRAINGGSTLDPERIMAYLWKALRRGMVDHFRRESVRPREVRMEPEQLSRIAGTTQDPEATIAVKDQVRLVLRELGRVDADVLVRAFLLGESVEEMRQELKLETIGAVKSKRLRACERARGILEKAA